MLEQTEQRSLRLVQTSAAIIYQLLRGIEGARDGPAFFETKKNSRANISRAANRRGVAKGFRGLFYGGHDPLFFARLCISQINARARQSAGANKSAGPGAKVFCRETFAHHFLNIAIDVSSFDIDELTVAVLILENFLCRLLEQVAHNSGDAAIFQLLMMLHLTLALEIEANQITLDAHVFGPESGQPITAVLAGVDLTTGSDEAGRQNAQDGSHHSFAPESGFPELARDDLAHVRQSFCKLQQPIEFLPLGSRDMVRVIEILPAAGSVLADGLKQPAGSAIDGHIGPGWWDPQGIDPVSIRSSDPAAARADVTKPSLGCSEPANAGRLQSFELCHAGCAKMNSGIRQEVARWPNHQVGVT